MRCFRGVCWSIHQSLCHQSVFHDMGPSIPQVYRIMVTSHVCLCTMNRLAVDMLFLSYQVRDRYASMPPIMLQFMLEHPKPAMQGIKPQSRFYAQANATAAQASAARQANGIPRVGAPLLLFAVELCPPLVMVPDAVGPTSLAPPVLDACA